MLTRFQDCVGCASQIEHAQMSEVGVLFAFGNVLDFAQHCLPQKRKYRVAVQPIYKKVKIIIKVSFRLSIFSVLFSFTFFYRKLRIVLSFCT